MAIRKKAPLYVGVLIGFGLISMALSIPGARRPEALSGEGEVMTRFVAEYDPLEVAERTIDENANPWAGVPSACYVKTDGGANSCWTCHAGAVAPNTLADWDLQERYSFLPGAEINYWTNEFRDRREEISRISDEEILAYIRGDNYTPLRRALTDRQGDLGYLPDLDFAAGFDKEGFANDGSGWRAIRYKPFPEAAWPVNGNTDDVMIRLPKHFRIDADGKASREVYKENLAILEASFGSSPFVFDEDVEWKRVGLPKRYAGAASGVPVRRRIYPVGTEFLHSVRYFDPDVPGGMARRMKELRHMRKEGDLDETEIGQVYAAIEEEEESGLAGAPEFEGTPLTGLRNDFGWRLIGFIEDRMGRLRVQTREEQMFCMGCHNTIGITNDSTFSFARKVPGADGWRPQDLRGMKDVPQVRHEEGEVLTWLRRMGNSPVVNPELRERFVPAGRLDIEELGRAAPGGDKDLSWLLFPSRGRALDLARAYRLIVMEQSFDRGRSATIAPAAQFTEVKKDQSTNLREAGAVHRDGRLQLDWNQRN